MDFMPTFNVFFLHCIISNFPSNARKRFGTVENTCKKFAFYILNWVQKCLIYQLISELLSKPTTQAITLFFFELTFYSFTNCRYSLPLEVNTTTEFT